MEDDIETRRIVRIYSFEAEERLPPSSDAHALGRVLSEEEPSLEDITAPWRRFFEPWEAQDSERYMMFGTTSYACTESKSATLLLQ